ncbi:hypothetical protein GCM10011314_28520 [Knoellia flava]|uniref:Uncharacterized protein n=1 Tax=Knoellia flava TaxID=913969 RepID=A0A8H9FV76_9MICO|nr:hypothetical protein GCM10011314_28520 [Knoellia flava]
MTGHHAWRVRAMSRGEGRARNDASGQQVAAKRGAEMSHRGKKWRRGGDRERCGFNYLPVGKE